MRPFLTYFSFYFYFQIKREELLQFAQGAIAGPKINADLARWLRNIFFLLLFFAACFGINIQTKRYLE